MKIIKRLLLVIFVLVSTMAVAGPFELGIAQKSIPETAQMLLLGICLVGLAGYGRKRIYKK
jgi:hypothetical protein